MTCNNCVISIWCTLLYRVHKHLYNIKLKILVLKNWKITSHFSAKINQTKPCFQLNFLVRNENSRISSKLDSVQCQGVFFLQCVRVPFTQCSLRNVSNQLPPVTSVTLLGTRHQLISHDYRLCLTKQWEPGTQITNQIASRSSNVRFSVHTKSISSSYAQESETN